MVLRVLAVVIFALVVALALTGHADGAIALAVVGIGGLTLNRRAHAAR